MTAGVNRILEKLLWKRLGISWYGLTKHKYQGCSIVSHGLALEKKFYLALSLIETALTARSIINLLKPEQNSPLAYYGRETRAWRPSCWSSKVHFTAAIPDPNT
jgi:hypothetical protein